MVMIFVTFSEQSSNQKAKKHNNRESFAMLLLKGHMSQQGTLQRLKF